MLTAQHIGNQSRMTLSPATQRRRMLMGIVLGENGTVDLTLTPEGAAALPFVGLPPGGTIRGKI